LTAGFVELDETYIAVSSIRTIKRNGEAGTVTVEFTDGSSRTNHSKYGVGLDDLDHAVVPADPTWKLAEYEDGKVSYQTIIAFALLGGLVTSACTAAAAHDPDASAIVDPHTGHFHLTDGTGECCENEAAFIAAVEATFIEPEHEVKPRKPGETLQ
jgi:hypothetical protein